MIWKASLVLSLALCVLSGKRPAISEQRIELFTGHHGHLSHIGQYEPELHEIYAWAYPSYEFSYHVNDPHTHDMKGQHEIRDGDKVTGNYWLIQPDGRKRTVKYSSDHKSGFHAEVHYQPHDGHHYEVKEDHENIHNHDHHHWEHRRRRIEESKGDRWNGDHDRKGRIGIDESRHDDHDERHDGRGDKQDHDGRRGHDDKRGHNDRRGYDDKRDHDDTRDHKDRLWGLIKQRKQNKGNRDDEAGDDGRRLRHGHEEHWKHGVLVGWKEGSDRDYNRRDRDDYNRARDDRSKGNGYRRTDDDKRSDDSHENRRGQYSYHTPIMNFKPLIPYGQRLN